MLGEASRPLLDPMNSLTHTTSRMDMAEAERATGKIALVETLEGGPVTTRLRSHVRSRPEIRGAVDAAEYVRPPRNALAHWARHKGARHRVSRGARSWRMTTRARCDPCGALLKLLRGHERGRECCAAAMKWVVLEHLESGRCFLVNAPVHTAPEP
jgi:hypothetical protein